MGNFRYFNAGTISDAVGLLAEYGETAVIIAGGTNVMPDIRAGKIKDKVLINIRNIAELKGIALENGVITIGALTTLSEIAASELLRENAAALYMAAQVFADPTTAHSATIGGNNADASPAADTAAPLLALDATARVISTRGEREIPMNEWFLCVRKTALAADELLISFSFKSVKSAYFKLGCRKAMSISVLSAAAAAETDADGKLSMVRVALGSVAPTPVRAYNAEKALIGKPLDEAALALMADELQKDILPLEGDIRATVAYRRRVSPVYVKRALKKACFGECD